jgi:glycosyltransferase involved in cell wall biosynthesis
VDCADITFVILTRNEAHNIEACLASLPPNAHALLCDSASQDDTTARARALGATVVEAPWTGFVPARAAAAELVRTPWTFMLDADERLTLALTNELRALAPPQDVVAYSVARRNFFCGQWVRSAGWWPDRLVRLFRTGRASVVARSPHGEVSVHETWQPHGSGAALREPIDHYSYASTDQYRTKFARYTDLEAASGQRSFGALAGAWLLVPLRFAWLLLARQGILDGWRGVYVSAGSALYPAVVAAKRWRRRSRAVSETAA